MKHKFLPFLLAVILGAAALTACSSPDTATGDEAVNRVYPEGEGRFFEPTEATQVTVASASTSATGTTAATKATAKPATSAATTVAKTTTAVNPAVTSTQTTVQSNVPADNMSGSNINPNIGAIQGNVQAQIDALAVKSISLTRNSLTVSVGETASLTVLYNPTNAVNKSCSAAADNQNVSVAVSGNTVSVTGAKAGTCTLTVTSANGHKATCTITVKPSRSSVTDDTALDHGDLVSAANVERWTTAITNDLAAKGMVRNTALQGNSIVLETNGLNNMSYNTVLNDFIRQAEASAEQMTSGNWNDYEFNCTYRAQSNGEYAIVISLNEL